MSTHDPSPAGNVADLLRLAAQRHGGQVALITATGRSTWSELDAAADHGVTALRAGGAVAGDRVLMALPTGPDQAAALFAVLRAGLVAVQVEPGHRDLRRVGERVGARVAVTDRDGHGCPARVSSAEIGGWWESVAGVRHPAGASGEASALFARSGRAGPPVMVSHRAILAAVSAAMAAPGFDLAADDRLVQALPLYHLVGLVSTLLPAAVAGSAVVVPDLAAPGRTHAEAVLAAIRDHAVTVVPAEPTTYRQLCRVDDFAASVAGVRLLLSGSYALDPADLAAIREASGLTVRQGYGISESAATVTSTLMSPAPPDGPRPGSVGLAYPGIAVRIISDDDVDDQVAGAAPAPRSTDGADRPDGVTSTDGTMGADGTEGTARPDDTQGGPDAVARDPGVATGSGGDTLAELPDDGGIGRIAICGPTLFSGYWPDGAGGPDADGWFVSGDIGYLDDAGELHLVDRLTETIVVSGFTVYPREVESALCDHPAVADAAVIGVPTHAGSPGAGSPGAGSTVVAVVVPRPGARPSFADLDAFLAGRVAPFKRPRAFQLVAVLPRTEVGRLDRDALRAGFAAGSDILSPPDAPSQPEPATDGRPAREARAADPAAVEGSLGGATPTDRGDGGSKTAPRDASDAHHDPDPDPDAGTAGVPVGPERAGELSELGARLPATGSRAGRGAKDTDDDLF